MARPGNDPRRDAAVAQLLVSGRAGRARPGRRRAPALHRLRDGESAVVELRITEEQIAQFEARIADANLKLSMIKKLLSGQNTKKFQIFSTVDCRLTLY